MSKSVCKARSVKQKASAEEPQDHEPKRRKIVFGDVDIPTEGGNKAETEHENKAAPDTLKATSGGIEGKASPERGIQPGVHAHAVPSTPDGRVSTDSLATAGSPSTIAQADNEAKLSLKGSALKSGRGAFRANATAAASKDPPMGTLDQCIAKVKSFKNPVSMAPFSVIVQIISPPPKDCWTRAACADPYNRNCQAWLRAPKDVSDETEDYVCFHNMVEEDCCRSPLYRAKLHLVGVGVKDMNDPGKKDHFITLKHQGAVFLWPSMTTDAFDEASADEEKWPKFRDSILEGISIKCKVHVGVMNTGRVTVSLFPLKRV